LNDLTKLHGDVVSLNETRIYPNLGGTLLERKVSVGDRISRGTTIALVDPSRPGQSYLPNPVESTVTGTVLSIPVHEGDTIGTGTVIATVGNLDRILVATAVPERFIANLSPGTRAEITFDALPGQKYEARIVEMSPIVDATSRTLDIKLALDRQDGRVLAGMFATIWLVTESRKNVLIAPRQGVTLTSTGAHVFVISADGKAERRSVELGLETENAFEVKKGLAAGERIITEGKASVSHGDMVRVLDDSAQQASPGRPSGAAPGTQGGSSQR
jgi:multidrug efflux pump subunit AcrA (membrane-fusion protein)